MVLILCICTLSTTTHKSRRNQSCTCLWLPLNSRTGLNKHVKERRRSFSIIIQTSKTSMGWYQIWPIRGGESLVNTLSHFPLQKESKHKYSIGPNQPQTGGDFTGYHETKLLDVFHLNIKDFQLYQIWPMFEQFRRDVFSLVLSKII